MNLKISDHKEFCWTPGRRTGSACRVGEHRCAGIPSTVFVWPRVPHPLSAFSLLPFSPPTIVVLHVSCSTFPYFLFLPHFLHFPVLSRTSRPKILMSMPAPGPSSSVLPSLCLYPSLPYLPVLWILP